MADMVVLILLNLDLLSAKIKSYRNTHSAGRDTYTGNNGDTCVYLGTNISIDTLTNEGQLKSS